MTVIGHQSTWITGSRFLFKRDPVGGIPQPLIDLGVIQVTSPSQNVETVTLQDGDGGRLLDFDEAITTVEETYEIVCSNLNNENLAILYSSERPTQVSQNAAQIISSIWAIPGHLVECVNADGDPVYNVSSIFGVSTGALTAHPVAGGDQITDMDAATKTITFASAQTFSDGDPIIVLPAGLSNIANARTYTIDGATSSSTTAVVHETIASDETSVTVAWKEEDTGTIYVQDTDWDIYNKSRGLVRMISGGAFATAANLDFHFSVNAVTGLRSIEPQSLKGSSIKGEGILYWSRSDFSEEHIRRMRVSLTPSDAAFSNEDFSNFTLTAKVLVDLTSDQPAGVLIHSKGTVPNPS